MSKRYVLLGMTLTLAIALAVPAMGGPGNPVASAAASAKSIAKKALKKAKKAQRAAKTAQATANGAASSAATANSNANGAKAQADAAKAAADAAQATANQAKDAAAAAQSTADKKFGSTYNVEGDEIQGSDSNQALAAVACGDGINSPDRLTGGGFIVNGNGNNAVTVTMSTAYLNGWIARAEEAIATGEAWDLTASAVCASTAPFVPTEE